MNEPKYESAYVAAANMSEALGQERPDVPDASEDIGDEGKEDE